MRILFLADFIPPRHIGGPGKRNWEVAQKLRELGHEVFFITSCQKKDEEIDEKRSGIKIFNVYSNYPGYLRDYLSIYNPFVLGKVKKIIKKTHPDVVHADIVHTHLSYASLGIARKYSRAVFLHARDFMFFYHGKFFQKERECTPINYKVGWLDNLKAARKRFNPFGNFLIKRYLRYADKIVVISHELAEALKQNGIDNTVILHNGFPLPQEEPVFSGFESKKILLYGRLSGAKGIYALLDAFPLVKEKVAGAKVILVGADEEERGRVDEYISKNNLDKKDIEVHGWIKGDETMSILKSVAMVVSPSIYPDPLLAGANYEAAAHKKPVVTTCFGGAKEFVLDGETGYVANPFNKEELARKIIDILIDREKAKRYGEAAYKRLKEKFSLEIYAEKILGLYKSYLSLSQEKE